MGILLFRVYIVLFYQLLVLLLCKGSAVAPCSKDHCTSSWPWGIYSCYNIYSFNRGIPRFLIVKIYFLWRKLSIFWLVEDMFLFLMYSEYYVGLYSPKACFGWSVACPAKRNRMFILSFFNDTLILCLCVLTSVRLSQIVFTMFPGNCKKLLLFLSSILHMSHLIG